MPVAPAYPRKEALADKEWKKLLLCQRAFDVRRRFQKAPLSLNCNEDAKRLIFERIFKGPLSISIERNVGAFGDLRPKDYMYRPTSDNSFPNLEPVDVVCAERGAAMTGVVSNTIYSSNTYPLGVGSTWDPNGSKLFNRKFEPFVGLTHQRAEIKSRNYWGAASHNLETDRNVDFEFSKARTIRRSAASRSGLRQLIVQLYGKNQESALLAGDVDGIYNAYEFEVADFKEQGSDFKFVRVKSLFCGF